VPIPTFEIACVVVIAATLAVMARKRAPLDLLRDYVTLAVAGYVGEQTCISLYGFYAYAPGWHAFVGDVPLLVPLIWPLVILSARDVVAALFPWTASPNASARSRWAHGAIVGVVVTLDASLVEVVAVRAGLWSWSEPGHLGVPLVGILGWGFFAGGASVPRARVASMIVGLLTTHTLLLATWWGLLRWVARGDLGALGFVPLVVLSTVATWAAWRARRQDRVMTPDVWGPRVAAAGLFFVLLAVTAPRDLPLLAHTALVAIPYLTATSLRRSVSAR
jgi:hypothetical protein